jgi:hypothetical protein
MLTSLKNVILLDDTIREVRSTSKKKKNLHIQFYLQKARSDETKNQLNTNRTKVHFKRRFVATDSEELIVRKYSRMDLT